MQSQSQLGLEKNAHLQLSRQLFLHCYRDEFDSVISMIKKQLRENEGHAAAENLKKDVNTKSCPEDAWLPIPKFDILVQNAKNTWANLVDVHGRTLLHYCCGSKQELAPLAARYLLDSKASLLICDADGKFPVHYLARQGNVLMFERCPEFLRVVSQKSENALAETPYDVAKSKKQTSFINFLMAKCPRIIEDVHKREATRKLNSLRHSPSLDSPIISRRPSSAKSSDYNALSPTSSKRDSLKSNKSDDNEGNGPLYELDEDDEFNDSAERLATVPSFDDLFGEAQKEQSDVDELYRIACEFTKWEPPMSKALVLRWFNIYVYNRGSCLDVILRPHCGNAVIHQAVIHGCTDAVIILLKLGASTDVQNDDGHTPLHLACMLGFAAIVHELLKVGADVHRQDKDGCIPVELITNTKEGAQIVMLMFRFASTLSIDDNERDQSLLETMIEKQHFEIVNLLLLMRPWSAFHVNLKGETLLHCAAKAPYDSAAILTGKVLVSLGVDASTKNSQELTALEVCSELYSPLSSFLSDPLAVHIQRMQSIWHLVQLTELGYWNDQKLFEESSKKFSIADSNSGKAMTLRGSNQSIKHLHKTDSDCNNLLHRACSIGAVALAQKLLNGGLAGLPQNLNGDTPLHVAAFNGQNDIILCLFAVSFTKSLMHSTNKHGFSAFDLAAFQGHVSVLATFLSWGYTEKCNKISPKSLFAAFSGKRWNVVVFLLENLPHESKICLDKDDNNFLHYLAALDSQDVTAFFQRLPSSKIHFLFEKRCMKKKNIMNMDPFEMAGKKHNVTFLGVFRRYCASCIVCCARQFVARRRLHQRQCAATSQATAVWKVKGYPYAMTKHFVLWTALGAIVELYEKAIFIRKMLPKGVATQMGLTAGSSITAMWDVNNMDYHMVRIVKQAHCEHFQLNGMLAVQINTSNGNLKSLETDEMHDNSMFRLENGDLVRLSSHEFEEIDANHFHSNIFRFAATEKNKVSIPFSYNCLMALEGPHLILKIVSWTGAQNCSESIFVLQNAVSRSELQLNFHPKSDNISNLLFAPLDYMKKALQTNVLQRRKFVRKQTETFSWGKHKKLHQEAKKAPVVSMNEDHISNFTAEDLYIGSDTLDDARVTLYRPEIELFETVEKLDADAMLPCTVIAAVSKDCVYVGAERLQAGDQIIAIDAHRTMNLKTAQCFLEGNQDSVVTITVSRPIPENEKQCIEIIRAKLLRTTFNPWLSWVESTILLQKSEDAKSEIKPYVTSDQESFVESVCKQQLAACEMVFGRVFFQELFRSDNLPLKHLTHRFGAYTCMLTTLTAAADRIKAVYRAHIIRRSIVCNFTLRQSLEEKSKATERILLANGLATQLVIEWVNSGLLGESPLKCCIENGHSEGLLQLIQYGFGLQASWWDRARTRTFCSLMDSAVECKAAKASLILIQELGMLPILENSRYTQTEKAEFVMIASIKYSAVDVLENLIENPSVMQCLGESMVQKNLTMAIQFGRVDAVHAILKARPRMASLRMMSFPKKSSVEVVLRKVRMPKYPGSTTHLMCFDFAVVSMLLSFTNFGCVMFSQNQVLNPLECYIEPSLIESLQNFAAFRALSCRLNDCHREAEVLKAIANGIAVRCRKRKEESMIQELKMLYETRQEESRKASLAKKKSAWSKIETTHDLVSIARNFRLIAMESNMDRELERERSASQKHLNSNVDRELSQSASRMRIEGKSVPRGPARRGQK